MIKRWFRRFIADEHGIILVGVIAIAFIILSTVVWLVLALVVNRTFDALQPLYAICDPRALFTSQNAVNAFGVSIVIVDVMFLVWWGLSAQKRGSQEEAMPF